MQQKSKQLLLYKEEDRNYANIVKRDTEAHEALEKEREKKHRVEMQNYREVLRKQIEDANKKKLFKDVMSEHERKVNGLDLDAYEKMDLHLHSKLVGAKDITEVGSNVPSPEIKKLNETPHKSDVKLSPNYELTKKINMVDNIIKNDDKYARNVPAFNSSQRIVKMAIENMLDPRMRYMRNNTHNKIYGYNGERYFQFADSNKSIAVQPSTLDSNAYGGSALAAAGRSQIINPTTVNLSPEHTYEKFANYNEQTKTDRNEIQGIYLRHKAPVKKRYTDYNIITGDKE